MKTIDAIDAELKATFPDRAFYSAWTSPRIMAKVLAERGEQHDSLAQAFERLTADGVDDLVVGTMCLMPGKEMACIQEAAGEWAQGEGRTLGLASPLLETTDDCRTIAQAVVDEFAFVADDEALLLMGHGSPHKGNEVYADMQEQLRALGKKNFVVGTVSGIPSFDDIVPVLQELAPRRVHLAPLMVVAGDHAKNDMAGDSDNSWANRLHALGFSTEAHLKGLGEYPGVRALACEHARAAAPVA